jgi:hypothetical protein
MKHPRDWSNRGWVLAASLLIAALVLANQIQIGAPSTTLQGALVKFAPVAAVIVALGSLIVTAVSTTLAWRRQKRQATIEAWTAWSDKTVEARKCLTKHLGPEKISGTQARALVDRDIALTDKDGKTVSEDEVADIGNSMVLVLNGLERLATGARLGVYDGATLRTLGATIIVRTRERFGPYIERRRTTDDEDLRQKRAYIALDRQVRELKRHELDRDRLKHFSR